MPEPAAPHPTDRYIVATDGACKGNPGPAGWAWVGEDGNWAAGSLPEGTNNIGELLGLLYAITDHADGDVPADIGKNLPVCMKNIAMLVSAWVGEV